MATVSSINEFVPRLVESNELANTLTHGAGLLLSLLGAGVLLSATSSANVWIQLAAAVYVLTLIAVYGLSTLSHAVQHQQAKHVLRVWDQGTIYLLIVGTYTPFVAAYLTAGHAVAVVVAIWSVALIGFCSKVILQHRVQALATWSYLLLGWLPATNFVGRIPFDCILWMALGGISYTAGTIFLMLDHRARYFHAIWHVLVIVGSACHFYAIMVFAVS